MKSMSRSMSRSEIDMNVDMDGLDEDENEVEVDEDQSDEEEDEDQNQDQNENEETSSSSLLLSQLKNHSKSQLEKGYQIKKQFSLYNHLLELRIGFESVLKAGNGVGSSVLKNSTTTTTRDEDENTPHAHAESVRNQALMNLSELDGELFDLRKDLFETNDHLSLPSETITLIEEQRRKNNKSKKRKRNEEVDEDEDKDGEMKEDDDDDEKMGMVEEEEEEEEMDYQKMFEICSRGNDELDKILNPLTTQTLKKWSSKIAAVSSLSNKSSSSNPNPTTVNLKSFNQDVSIQVDNALKMGRKELIGRTKKRRRGFGGKEEGMNNNNESNKSNEKEDDDDDDVENEDIFDDSDFYEKLLRDIVLDGGGLGLDDDDISRRNGVKSKSKKKDVDRKASKGRKIRYHPIAKLQNFMIPIPLSHLNNHPQLTELQQPVEWHDEQIHELFSSLPGRREVGDSKMKGKKLEKIEKGGKESDGTEVGMGKLRLFG